MPLLEQLDLIVDPSTTRVIPNPRSPEMPMVEVLMATSPNSMYAVRSRAFKPFRASHTRKILGVICLWVALIFIVPRSRLRSLRSLRITGAYPTPLSLRPNSSLRSELRICPERCLKLLLLRR